MKRVDINYIVSLLLLFSMVITGITSYIQSQLDLRKFVPHIYFAYITLVLCPCIFECRQDLAVHP
jgi:hypothetical protein